jgi:hypothetical protein
MHATISVFKPIIKSLAGATGLKEELGLAQNIFKINYYMKKYKGQCQALAIKLENSVDDEADLEDIKELAYPTSGKSNELGTYSLL